VVSPIEAEAARRLAGALEGAPVAGVDETVLAIALMITAARGGVVADELGSARLRRQLLAAAAHRRARRFARRAAAAAAVVVFAVAAGVLLLARPQRTDLAAREAAARAAVARVLREPGAEGDVLALHLALASARRDRLMSDLESSRFDAMRRRFAESELVAGSAAQEPVPASAPTPGGLT
jgi:hypothetical protein